MNAFRRFCNGLHQARGDFNEILEELIAFSEIMSQKANTIELDDNGFFYVTSSGPLEEVIPTLRKQLVKLERIKEQRDNQH